MSKACTRERSLSFSILYTPLRCLAQPRKKILNCLILFCQRSTVVVPPAPLSHSLAIRSKNPSCLNHDISKEKVFLLPTCFGSPESRTRVCDRIFPSRELAP